MKKRIISIILILLLCLTCLPVSVFADASSSTDVEALYEQAKALIEAEKYEEAIPLLTEAADLGYADAQNYLGTCYQLGTGVEQSYEAAARYYKLAADQGNAKAQFNLGCCYYLGVGVDQSYEAAVRYYRLAADQGLVEAQTNLGYCYFYGYGVDQSYDEALKYLTLAAGQGIPEAMFGIGECYYAMKDWSTAAEWFLKAIEAGFEPDEEDEEHIVDVAEFLVDEAVALLDAEDYEAAIPFLMEAAALGSARAKYDLGLCYFYGDGVEQDYEKTVEYFRLAADQGYAKAQYNLGVCYDFGYGVEQDYEEAVRYYRMAADQGLALAQYNLGVSYEYGDGVDQDYEEAVRYYRMAADQGYANAQYNLGVCYEKGRGVEQDYEEALKYFTLAAEQGVSNAIFGVGECYYAKNDWKTAAEWYIKALEAGYEPDEEDKVHLAEVLTSRFTDVNETDWYYDSVGYVAARGIMTGMRADYFGAAEKLSRGQFATVLYRMAGKPEVDYEDVFPDVKESDWFGVPVSWAAENGVITGYENGKFGPADDITREQIAVMLYRYAKYMEYDTSEKADLNKYPDKKNVSDWAKDAMEWAVGAGIIQGKDGGKTLAPQGKASCAECATMVMRFCEKYAG